MEAVKVIILLLFVAIFFNSCKIKNNVKMSFNSISECEKYIKSSENKKNNIVPQTEKKIIFSNKDKEKTKIALIYIHGFSATRQEISPVTENLAKELNVNIFYTRLRGHGRETEDMRKATAKNMIKDTKEAVEIGLQLGEKVVLIGTSVGAPLCILMNKNYKNRILSYIFVSPSFDMADSRASLLTLPLGLGRFIARIVVGKYKTFTPNNPEHKLYWTEKYPSSCLVEMMKVLSLGKKVKIKDITAPVQIIYNPKDDIISIDSLKELYYLLPSKHKELHTIYSSKGHDMTGDINSPENTEKTILLMKDFLKRINL